MKKCFLLTLCAVVMLLFSHAQVVFKGEYVKNNLEIKAQISKGWRIYSKGDTAINLAPVSITWKDIAIVKAGDATINNKHLIKDAFFGNAELEVADQDFTLLQPVIIKEPAPATLLVKISGFAANEEQFIPFDTVLQVSITANTNNDTTENNLLLGTVDLDNPVSLCGNAATAFGFKKGAGNYWIIFLKGFAGGLLALLMPCIFPMIPVTISVFTGKSNGIRNSIFYGLSIILIYTLASLPFHIVNGLNPQILNELSTNTTVNLLFFAIFIAFALSLFGVFEIQLPATFGNKAGNKTDAGSLAGIFFMALTLCIISFSCTGPILGFLLASSTSNGAWPLTIGMFGFGLALALPFTLFALFPGWLKKIPKSGEWMDTLKKAFAFIELALALKFLSNADLVNHWGLLKRETFIAIWILISLALAGFILVKANGSYLMGFLSLIVLIFSFYLGVGLIGQSDLSLLSGFPPPVSYSIHTTPDSNQNNKAIIINDYAKALKLSREHHKPILIDFTGWACVNCRKMEENVWSKPAIKNLLENEFILVSLYVDDRKPLDHPFLYEKTQINTVGDKWASFQLLNFKQSTQPLYVILNENEQLLNHPAGYTPDENDYREWLQCGIRANNPQP